MRRLWRQCSDERGMALVMALFTMAILLAAGTFLLRMSATEGNIAYNSMWGEGSFFAADAAINLGLDLGVTATPNPTTPYAPGLQALPGGFTYTPTATFTGQGPAPGYSLGSGTGYNPGGYVFYTFGVTGQGNNSQRNAQRTINVVAAYGPVAQ